MTGAPATADLKLAKKHLGATFGAIVAADTEVKTGAGLGYALGREKVFPRLAVQMIQVGEESGALDTLLLKTADGSSVKKATLVMVRK